jgi:hypothetical protein
MVSLDVTKSCVEAFSFCSDTELPDFPCFGIKSAFWSVSVDLSSVLSQQVTLDFSLLGDDDGLTTTVWLDNVDLSLSGQAAIPEPGSLLLWMGTGLAAVGFMARRSHFIGRVTRRTRMLNTTRRTP